MRMSLLGLGIILVVISHGLHHYTLRRLQRGGRRQTRRSVAVYHGFLYLGLAYVTVGLWRPAWLNPRVTISTVIGNIRLVREHCGDDRRGT